MLLTSIYRISFPCSLAVSTRYFSSPNHLIENTIHEMSLIYLNLSHILSLILCFTLEFWFFVFDFLSLFPHVFPLFPVFCVFFVALPVSNWCMVRKLCHNSYEIGGRPLSFSVSLLVVPQNHILSLFSSQVRNTILMGRNFRISHAS